MPLSLAMALNPAPAPVEVQLPLGVLGGRRLRDLLTGARYPADDPLPLRLDPHKVVVLEETRER